MEAKAHHVSGSKYGGHHYTGGFFPQKFQPSLDLVPSAAPLGDVFGGLKRERKKNSP